MMYSMNEIQSIEDIHPEDRQLLDQLLKFSSKQNQFRLLNSNKAVSKDLLIKSSLSYVSADDLFVYNRSKQAHRQAKMESFYIVVCTTLAGALYNVIRTPVHKKVLFKTIKFLGLGLGLGYIRWRVSAAKQQEVVNQLGKKIMNIRKGQM